MICPYKLSPATFSPVTRIETSEIYILQNASKTVTRNAVEVKGFAVLKRVGCMSTMTNAIPATMSSVGRFQLWYHCFSSDFLFSLFEFHLILVIIVLDISINCLILCSRLQWTIPLICAGSCCRRCLTPPTCRRGVGKTEDPGKCQSSCSSDNQYNVPVKCLAHQNGCQCCKTCTPKKKCSDKEGYCINTEASCKPGYEKKTCGCLNDISCKCCVPGGSSMSQ